MRIVLFLALMFFVGSIVVAAILIPILIRLIKNKGQTRYITMKLVCTAVLFILSVAVAIGSCRLMIAVINF